MRKTRSTLLVHVVAFLTGIAGPIAVFVHHVSPAATAVVGGGGALLAICSTVAKLLHDKGVHVASIQAAGWDFAAALPQLRADLAAVQAFVETDWPGSKELISRLKQRLDELGTKIAEVPGVDELVDAAVARLRAQLAPPAAPPPAASPAISPGDAP